MVRAVDTYSRILDIDEVPVYLMPAGGTTMHYDNNEKWVADLAMKNGWRYTPRYRYNYGKMRGELNMKFVTVMDMWLLIINIGLMGFIIYFGRNLLKTITRLMHVGEQKENNAERQRCIKLIEIELEHYKAISGMRLDAEADQVVHTLEYVLEQIKKGK